MYDLAFIFWLIVTATFLGSILVGVLSFIVYLIAYLQKNDNLKKTTAKIILGSVMACVVGYGTCYGTFVLFS